MKVKDKFKIPGIDYDDDINTNTSSLPAGGMDYQTGAQTNMVDNSPSTQELVQQDPKSQATTDTTNGDDDGGGSNSLMDMINNSVDIIDNGGTIEDVLRQKVPTEAPEEDPLMMAEEEEGPTEEKQQALSQGKDFDELIDLANSGALAADDAERLKDTRDNTQIGDVALGIAGGPGKFIHKGGDVLRKLGVPNHTLQIFDENGDMSLKFLSEDEVEAKGGQQLIIETNPKTEAGKTAQKISAYIFGTAVSVPAITAAAAVGGSAGLLGVTTAAEAVVGGIMADPNDVRLATLLNEVPALGAIIPDYMADTNGGHETYWENKLKGAIEGGLVGGVATGAGAGATKLGGMFLSKLKSVKAARLAAKTDKIKLKPTIEEVLKASERDAKLAKEAADEFISPISQSDLDDGVTKAIDDMFSPKDVKGKVKDVPDMSDIQSTVGPDGKIVTKDLGDVNAAKAGMEEVPTEALTPAGRAAKENAEMTEDLMKKGYAKIDIEDAGDLSSTAGIKTSDGRLLNSVDEVTPAPSSSEAGLTKGLIQMDNGVAYLDTSRIASSEELTAMFDDAAKRAIASDAKGTSHETLKQASKKELDDLNNLLTRQVERPLTAEEVVAANTLLNAADNTILSLNRKVLQGGTKEDFYQFSRALAAKADIEEVVQRGAQANGQALNAYKVDVTDAMADYVPTYRNVLTADGKVIDDYSLHGPHNKIMTITDSIDGNGKLKPGIKVKDGDGNIVQNVDSIIPGQEEIAAIQKANAFNQKAAMNRSKQITEILKDKTRDLRTTAILIDDIARNAPEALSKVTTKMSKLKQLDQGAYNIWINGLLSSPSTHVANAVGNTVTALMGIPRKYATEFSKMIITKGQTGSLAAANAYLTGTFQGIMDGLSLMTGKTVNKALLAGSKLENVVEMAPKIDGIAANMLKKVDAVIGLPGWALEKEDLFFKGIAYRASLNSEAAEMAVRNNLKGEEAKKFIKNFIANPDEAHVTKAVNYARKQTFTNEVGKFTKDLQTAINSTPVGKWFVPFVRTPSNILKYSAEHVPVLNCLAFKADRQAMGRILRGVSIAGDAEVLGRMVTGSTIMAGIAYMTLNDMVTGSGPSNYQERQALELTGWRPYSIKVGDKYTSYERLEPFSSVIALTADLTSIMGNLNDTDRDTSTVTAIAGTARLWSDKTFVQGITRAVSAWGNGDKMAKIARDFADNMVPYSGLRKKVGSYIDNTQYIGEPDYEAYESKPMAELKSYIQRLKTSVGMGEGAPVKRDVWGQPRSYRETWLAPSFISPITESVEGHDPVNELIAKSGMVLPAMRQQMDGVNLTHEEYSRYVELSGQKAKSILDKVVKTGRFDDQFLGEDSMFQTFVRSVRTNSARSVQGIMYREFPALRQRKIQTERDKRTAKGGTNPDDRVTPTTSSGQPIKNDGSFTGGMSLEDMVRSGKK